MAGFFAGTRSCRTSDDGMAPDEIYRGLSIPFVLSPWFPSVLLSPGRRIPYELFSRAFKSWGKRLVGNLSIVDTMDGGGNNDNRIQRQIQLSKCGSRYGTSTGVSSAGAPVNPGTDRGKCGGAMVQYIGTSMQLAPFGTSQETDPVVTVSIGRSYAPSAAKF
ncbi:hypothetical protein BT67DRAFT_20357 [Trichocladium antarcticum]|uniref:Uncharacterized protein n=1 Tax=Trichocladium antarcticum TaxID=1450529 RepID=A0AAN6UU93_9PEZI|nr:hypothetical protein BT67DRAFT_20357 [Trichocladium antarcticum]